MAVFNRRQIGLEKIGKSCNIPNHPKAKLMYYLDCMCSVLNLDEDGDITRLHNYQNYSSLSEEETQQLLLLCALLEPTVLIDKCIFQSDAMCGDSSNEFYELSQVSTTFAVANTMMLGGVKRNVQKIMTFKMSWLRNNFLEPFKELTETMTSRQRQQRAIEAQKKKKDDGCVIQ